MQAARHCILEGRDQFNVIRFALLLYRFSLGVQTVCVFRSLVLGAHAQVSRSLHGLLLFAEGWCCRIESCGKSCFKYRYRKDQGKNRGKEEPGIAGGGYKRSNGIMPLVAESGTRLKLGYSTYEDHTALCARMDSRLHRLASMLNLSWVGRIIQSVTGHSAGPNLRLA